MLQFGLLGLKTVCYGLNLIVLVCGAYLMGIVVAFNSRWKDADHFLARIFTTSPDIAFYLGLVIILVAVLGFFALFYCNIKFLTFYILVLILLIPTVIVCGFFLYVDGYSEWSRNHIRLNSFIRGMSPMRLNGLQYTFHCCGIEKYTDYILLWSLWGMDDTWMEPRPKTTRTRRPPITDIFTPYGYSTAKPQKKSAGRLDNVELVDFDPPTMDELDILLGYYQDPSQIEKFHISKLPKLAKRINRISSWMDSQFRNMRVKLEKWIKVNNEYIEKYTPILIVTAIKNFLRTVYNVYRYTNYPREVSLRWYYSSGWDEQLITNIRLKGLPLSCCKHPKTIKERCMGLSHDTWREGCRRKVPAYYQLKIYQFAILILCMVPVIAITAQVTSVYRTELLECIS